MTAELTAKLKKALAREGRPSSDYDLNPALVLPAGRKLRHAAVLVAVSLAGDRPRVILTKRSSALRHHPGQIAFAGGKVDGDDHDEIATALREAREEIGLPSEIVDVLGVLPPHETVTGFLVTPVLAMVHEPFTVIPEPGEVAEVFMPPFDFVTDPDNFSIQWRMWRGQRRQYYTVPWGAYYIWGATARMLRALSDQIGAP
jgi:8-oxo-dGTP pyrophosphatase MutT (NUDIX family)